MYFYYDPIFLEHRTPPGHPESAGRLTAIMQLLEARDLRERIDHRTSRAATFDEIALAHTPEHIESIRDLARAGGGFVDGDTRVGELSFDAACFAVGAVLDACDAVMSGATAHAFCAVRPPGHHAETARAMGFCLFNNVAVGARWLMTKHALDRVAIVDWDVHHGNGTQEIFEEDPAVFYASIHQSPLYPGTGLASETGRGAGAGTTLNIPLPPGTDDDGYRAAFERIAAELERFDPQFLLVSAGYDAHARDPLAQMLVTSDGFRWMMEWAIERADALCGGRLVAVLEGGYDLVGMPQGVAAAVEAMLERESR